MIIVLSDAYAAFSLPPDEARQKFIWIEDFTNEEAHQYLNIAQFMLENDQKRNEIFAIIGTRVADLKDLVEEGISR